MTAEWGGAWNEVSYQKPRHRADGLAGLGDSAERHSLGRLAASNSEQARLGFLSKFRGRCFRCLSSRHKVAGCREPVHFITCKLAGHISRHCPKHPKFAGRAECVKSRLGPVPPGQPLYARLRFPPPQGAMSAPAASLLRQADPARRPRDSRSVTVPSLAIEQAAAFLRSHAVTLRAADGVNATSPMAVGRALEAQLSVPVHLLCVTAYHPEHYFVVFTQPALQVNAVRRRSIKVDGAIFIVSAWHEHDHAVFDSLLMHVRVVIEGVPMHYWSVEGVEDILGKKVRVDRLDSRTLKWGHTKTFVCWVWTSDVANIPTKHTLAELPRGAGWVEEMEGFSPPDRRVAPPPATTDYTMLIHVDRIEDWTTPSPRSSHSGQSGLPSSDHDDRPFPAVTAASWTMRAEDGQRGARAQRRDHAPVANTGCNGMPLRGHGRDNDSNGGSRGAGQRSWKDVLLRRSRTPARKTQPGAERQHPVATDVQAAAEAAIAAPLDFGDDSYFDEDVNEAERVQLDAFSPTPSAATTDYGQFNRATPSTTRTMEVQLGAVTSRVCQLEITADDGNLQQHRGLFRATEPPILATPVKRPSAPPKSRTAATPTRHSARQAANTSSIPVAQRASFRIVKELGLLGPREKMTEDVAKALVRHFEEPLSDSDTAVIAKLTHLDSGALRVMHAWLDPMGMPRRPMFTKVKLLGQLNSFWISYVYGPTDDARKEDFLREITLSAPPLAEPWLINGDFNLIYEARDKSNLNLNRRLMGRFRTAIDTAGLDNPFSETEIWDAIKASPMEKAPGPDGYIGMFFKSCWQHIKADVMLAFNSFYHLARGDFSSLNTAMVVLIPKKDGATKIQDFRPISLIRSFAKLVAKVLSLRLSTVIADIISPAQSAFL
ncbi:hypothetical protein D1007_06363 [Hordeum vulgare]|nr:hypothetical protein D1007_06363 [Hordeum vulgare]